MSQEEEEEVSGMLRQLQCCALCIRQSFPSQTEPVCSVWMLFPPALHGAGGAAVPSPYECKHWDERVGACFPHVPTESAWGCSFWMQGQSEGSHLGVIPMESSGMAHSVLKGCVPTL